MNMIDVTKLNKKQIHVLIEQIAPNQFVKPLNTKADLGYKTDAQSAKSIAKDIYDSKQWLADNEQRAVNAIKRIPNNKQYELVQTELRKLTNGRGIGQYVKSFIQDGAYGSYRTLKYINNILKHLKQIDANPKTIAIFTDLQIVYKDLVKMETAQDKALGGPELRQFWQDYHHEILLAASIGALFIPGIGLLISAGISLGDAGMYWQEGNRYEAGIMAGFAIIPALGKLVTLSKPIAKLGAKGMAALGSKLAKSSKPILNRLEMAAIKDMSKYQKLIKTEMDAYFKARAANEAANIARKAGAKGAKKIIQKLGDGSLKASVVGLKTAGGFGVGMAQFDLYNKVWDKVYVDLGLDQKDLQDINKTSLQTLKKVKEGNEMKSKELLEKIIRQTMLSEQLQVKTKPTVTTKLKSPFKNQAEGDKFRQWMNLNKPSTARDLNLDKTGPYDNAIIIKAYNLYGKEYNAANKPENDNMTSLQWAGLILVGLAAGVAVFSIIKTAAWKTKLIYKNIKSLVPWIKKTKTTDIEKLITQSNIDDATKKELLLALKNPRIRVEIQGELNELLINGFKNNEGIHADDLMKILSPAEQAKYGDDIRRIQAARDKAAGKSTSSAASKGLSKIKITKVSRDKTWTTAQGDPRGIELEDYIASVSDARLYTADEIATTLGTGRSRFATKVWDDFLRISSNLGKPIGNKDGVWILNKHMDAYVFPNFAQWKQDLLKINPKMQGLNGDRYRRAYAKWIIVKNR